ncbi:MAG: helix-turn-helix domain-containing protein [Candidatus Brocadiales bacterium]
MIIDLLHPLRLERLKKGLTQYALAELSGVAQVKISYAERGYNCLKEHQKEALAKALGLTIKELFPEGVN